MKKIILFLSILTAEIFPQLIAPEVLSAESYGLEIQLRWEGYNPEELVQGYYSVERSNNGTTGWTEVGQDSDFVTYFNNKNVIYWTYRDSIGAVNTTRYYRVRYYDGSGYSAYSNIASAKTALRVFWVNTGGSDGNTGLSVAQAWRNLSKANSTLIAGDAVYVQAGTYVQIEPANSGTSSNAISYIALGNVYLTGSVYLIIGQDYINVRGFKPIGTGYVKVKDGSHILVEDIYANPSTTPTNNVPVNVYGSASYVTFRNCFFRGTDQMIAYQDLFHIQSGANHILLEGNYFIGGSHDNVLINGNHVVLKNNHWWSMWHHNTSVHSGGGYVIYDNNFFSRAGCGNYDYAGGSDFRSGASIRLSENCKLRGNTVQYGGSSDIMWGFVAVFCPSWLGGDLIDNNNYRNYIIQNNIINNYNGGMSLGIMSEAVETPPYLIYGENRIKNNVIWNNHKLGLGESVNVIDRDLWYFFSTNGAPPYSWPYPPSGDVVENNLIGDGTKQIRHYYSGSGNPGTDYYSNSGDGSPYADQNSYITFSNNISGDPLFIEADDTAGISTGTTNQDLNIDSTSPCIDAGAFLTQTNGSGSGSFTVIVDDAGYFYDGWNMTNGDRIQIGDEIVRILAIAGNTLTIDRSISWADNTNVSFPYAGDAPDIGMIEYGILPAGEPEPPVTEDPGADIMIIFTE